MSPITEKKLKIILRASILLTRQGQDVEALREGFIRQRGLKQYIWDMLGPDAKRPVRECRLLAMPARTPLKIDDDWADRSLVGFLIECYTAETFPCLVVVLADKGRITEKLL